MKDAAGQEVKGELAVLVDDGMSGVGPALIADDDVGLLRQHIGQLALALVSPVSSNDSAYHVSSPLIVVIGHGGAFGCLHKERSSKHPLFLFEPYPVKYKLRGAGLVDTVVFRVPHQFKVAAGKAYLGGAVAQAA
ncbi:hypothetical protein SDC9_166073 [bioreactor metagenome]|uniref:Uncharacterized protein n=1 Tax=bioreactor metagenome TaxID=1076179 RepID=A0A645FYJ6_9ZZZZ